MKTRTLWAMCQGDHVWSFQGRTVLTKEGYARMATNVAKSHLRRFKGCPSDTLTIGATQASLVASEAVFRFRIAPQDPGPHFPHEEKK